MKQGGFYTLVPFLNVASGENGCLLKLNHTPASVDDIQVKIVNIYQAEPPFYLKPTERKRPKRGEYRYDFLTNSIHISRSELIRENERLEIYYNFYADIGREVKQMMRTKHKPGDIVTINGTEFAVLDVEEGKAADGADKLFVILKEPFGGTPFSENGNNYFESELRNKVDDWFAKFSNCLSGDYVYARSVDLLTMDGRMNYGTMGCLAAPLTFDEWRLFVRHIPDCEKSYWLATGYGAPGRRGAIYALGVNSNGDWYSGGCSNLWAVRPAMWVSEELVDSETPLNAYSTDDLLAEIRRRTKVEP